MGTVHFCRQSETNLLSWEMILPMRITCIKILFLVVCAVCANAEPASLQSPAEPIAVKVVVVSMYETGEIKGDQPGEFQFWVERMPLDEEYAFTAGEYPLRYNSRGILGVCTGGGISNATASIMALGFDDRFDLSNAYWLIAGIAGGDPADVAVGSAVWARYVIDSDLLYEIDAREIPSDWPYGLIPLGARKPAKPGDDVSQGWTVDTTSFQLNAQLVDWANHVSQAVELGEYPASLKFSSQFKGQPGALARPRILQGETLSSSTYWHGRLMNQWANDWVQVYSNTDMNFMTTNMEDSGTLTALHRLDRLGLVDAERVLVLRTVSNYTVPPPGESAAWSATAEYPDQGLPALEAAYQVGRYVVDVLVDGWSRYASRLPAVQD